MKVYVVLRLFEVTYFDVYEVVKIFMNQQSAEECCKELKYEHSNNRRYEIEEHEVIE